jgi:predicted TIM-barrel fold metal-dependent hydrolase
MMPCQPPRAGTKKPDFAVPKNACDCHSHIFGPVDKYPYTANRSFTPPDALIPDYFKMLKALGVERTVVVQASVHGSDNRCTVDAVKEMGLHRARGIVMVNQDVSKENLREMDASGVRGTRFITTVKGGPTIEHLPGVAKKIAEFGWHIEMYVPRHLWRELLPVLKTLPVPVVFDHMGGMLADTPESDPDLQ